MSQWETFAWQPGATPGTTFRMSVPGGWLAVVVMGTSYATSPVTSSFVPDPEHTWDVEVLS